MYANKLKTLERSLTLHYFW